MSAARAEDGIPQSTPEAARAINDVDARSFLMSSSLVAKIPSGP
jgi:hypothetical protein